MINVIHQKLFLIRSFSSFPLSSNVLPHWPFGDRHSIVWLFNGTYVFGRFPLFVQSVHRWKSSKISVMSADHLTTGICHFSPRCSSDNGQGEAGTMDHTKMRGHPLLIIASRERYLLYMETIGRELSVKGVNVWEEK